MMKRILLILLLIPILGCNDIVVNPSNSPTGPTGPGTGVNNRIEFRVLGNPTSARVRFSSTVDGLTQTTTALPFNVAINTRESSLFLYIDATPQTYPILLTNPFLSAQIIVNGNLFREAISNDFTFNTISTFGTWRRE